MIDKPNFPSTSKTSWAISVDGYNLPSIIKVRNLFTSSIDMQTSYSLAHVELILFVCYISYDMEIKECHYAFIIIFFLKKGTSKSSI